jgi:hypothetical protein
MNSRSSVKPWTVACAPKIFVEIETGRMIETFGKYRLRNGHGSGSHAQVLIPERA